MSQTVAHPEAKTSARAVPLERLIVMANQIADFFSPYPGPRRAEGIRNHLRTYWDPRMRQDLIDHIAAGGDGVSPSIIEGAQLLTNGDERKGYYGPPKA